MIKFPILGSCQECGDLCLSVEQDGPGRETGVAHRDLAVRQRGHLDALTVRIAVPALEPANVSEFAGGHAVVRNDHFLSPSRQVNATPGPKVILSVIIS